jgi:hypothetical protein
MVRPLLCCFQLLVVFDVARFRCRWILVFWDMYSLVRWELFHMCYSVSVGKFLLHVGYSVVLEPGRWNSVSRALLRFGRWILLHVGYSGVLNGNHGELVGFSGTCDLSISPDCRGYVSLKLCFVLGWVLFTHTCFFSCYWLYLVFRYVRHAWAGVAHLLFTRNTTLYLDDSHS